MSTLPPDPYVVLGVSKDAQLPEIRSAHRKLVLKCHPDKVQDPELKALKQDEFQRVQQAYELLSDDKERQRYDDQVKLVELQKQMRAKTASASASRSAGSPAFKYEIRTNDRTYKTASSPNAKVYASYSHSYPEERASHMFDGAHTVRREASYQGKPSKREERERDRERERERDREREIREREKERERERERRKKAEDVARRAEKEAKEARRAEKKQREKEREKEREKDRKRETEDKKRHAKPYIETYDDDEQAVKSEKKKPSKKHEERRDRSTHREEVPPTTSSMPPPPIPAERSYRENVDAAINYIQASRQKHNLAARGVQPPAPTPPPVSSPFTAPEEEARRSTAKPRRGSAGDKAYKKPSKEVLEDPIVADASPSTRPHVQKSATSTGVPSGSPPHPPRTSTMPTDAYARPVPNLSRSQTYSGAYPDTSDVRGRDRTRMQAQVVEDDSDDEYERHRRERKHKSKKHRSPESRGEQVLQYRVDGGRTTLQNSYSRNNPEAQGDSFSYYPAHTPGVRVVEARPSMPPRDGSYSQSAGYAKYNKYKSSKAFDYNDVQYSQYPSYREEFQYPTGVA
ncbi:hypothetical protein FZEAL_1152 [Fusarium zealandicum]|uniref:J domain-containing protein n=1 Tax=Fusarium zealandicum TaxID=1053134 RepID=A0A8H4XPL5_9HYPO|nr:hypothetical protein FZEAL_1152 [Fusarium zealandicum]